MKKVNILGVGYDMNDPESVSKLGERTSTALQNDARQIALTLLTELVSVKPTITVRQINEAVLIIERIKVIKRTLKELEGMSHLSNSHGTVIKLTDTTFHQLKSAGIRAVELDLEVEEKNLMDLGVEE